MKKTFFLSVGMLSLVLLGNNALSNHGRYVRSFRPIQEDTLTYLKDNIIGHKDKYQHKPLNVLLQELKFSVKSYTILTWRPSDKSPMMISLYLDDKRTLANKNATDQSKIAFLDITFESEVVKKQAMILSMKNSDNWTDDEKIFYGNLLVKDVTGLQTHR